MANGLGLQGAYGVAGMQDSLEQLVAQRMKETLLRQQEQQRQFENERALSAEGLNERKFGESTRQFDAGLGLDRDKFGLEKDKFGLEQTQWSDMAPQRAANVAHTGAQTGEILRQPEKEAADRTHDTNIIDQRGRWNLREIGASGAEQRKTAGYGASLKAGQPGQAGPSPYMQERNTRNRESIDALIGKVSRWTTGAGSLLANLPETDARNFAAELDTLKANIAFGELTAMREASKTGGALGAVSERELRLLESTLGALDTGQSPENLKAQLAKIRDSVDRWEQASGSMSNGVTAAQVDPNRMGQMDAGGPKVGDIKTFPNGRRGRFDGKGWVPIQ